MKRIGDVMRNISIPVGNGHATSAPKEPEVRCSVCRDAGWVRMEVPPTHPSFGRLFPCQCKLAQEEDRRFENLRRLSNLDAFDNRGFAIEDFDPDIPGVLEAFLVAREFAANPEGWLFLHGGCGVGKTHLAVAIANEALARRLPVYFAVVPDLLDHLRTTFDPSSGVAYDTRFNDIRNAQLLVLDDLGTENTTPWAREKLYQIFNHRYNERLPTVVTSNQDLRAIEDRIASRLLDTRLTRVVHVDAEDYRRRGRSDYTRGRRR